MSDQIGLFIQNENQTSPLAHRVRPKDLPHFIGQDKLKNRIENLRAQNLPHIVFYGPPGCGKTTITKIIAERFNHKIYPFSAVLSGVSELRALIKEAMQAKSFEGVKPVIFIDEIHRFNKAQQDALLPHLESGDFVLFGATTENPNTTLNKAILSRVQRWKLEPLTEDNLLVVLKNVVKSEKTPIDEELLNYISKYSNGDARSALNQLETLLQNIDSIKNLDSKEVIETYLFTNRRYDKNSERHYDVISAFIKSIRGSDVDSAILWLAVMLDGGEDVEFIARRLIISASEDVGNADPRALTMATNAHYSIKQIGMPEARIILAQATAYLASAPKSNKAYLAIDEALGFVKSNPTIEVPTHLQNHHPDKEKYLYPHNYKNHWTAQNYGAKDGQFFSSSSLGYEKMQEDYQKKIRN